MSLTDEWIEKYSAIEAKKLHALGVVTFMWNACEYKLFELFHRVLGLNESMAWLLIHDLGDIAISNRITAYLDNAFTEPNAVRHEIDLIKNALEVYDICRQNRNQLTHFTLEHDLEAKQVHMRKVQKGPILKRVPFPSDLDDIRNVAIELVGLNNLLHGINEYLKGTPDPTLPLPSKVVLPELLWKPGPQAPQEPQPPRPPSVLRLTEDEWLAKYRKEGRSPPQAAQE